MKKSFEISFRYGHVGAKAIAMTALALLFVGHAVASRPDEARELRNVEVYANLLGYIRHFHPSDQSANADWNDLAVDGMRAVMDAENDQELRSKLLEHLKPFAPTVQILSAGEKFRPAPDLLYSEHKNDQYVWWRHLGAGQVESPERDMIYDSKRLYLKVSNSINTGEVSSPEDTEEPSDSTPKMWPNQPYKVDLGQGLTAYVPITLYADEEGTFPHLPKLEQKPIKASEYDVTDAAVRYASIGLAWSVYQHFYPYFDVVDVDWDAVLKQMLAKARTDLDDQDFFVTIKMLQAALKDGHGYSASATINENFYTPLLLFYAEGHIVVLNVADDYKGAFRVGDVLESVDGRPIDEVYAERFALQNGATEQYKRIKATFALLNGAKGSKVTVKAQHQDGTYVEETLSRDLRWPDLHENRPPEISEIRPGIYYVDPQRASNEAYEKAIPQLAEAKAIIFDFRCYPQVSPENLFLHVADEPYMSALWRVPVITMPDHRAVTYEESRWMPEPLKEPKFKGRAVYITDGRAISYAESCMGIVEAYRFGEIIGEPTAGSNGNVNPFALPGGYMVWWTGMRVDKHDGSTHHGVGIQPTIPMKPTIKGIAEGRDELLEKAIEIALQED